MKLTSKQDHKSRKFRINIKEEVGTPKGSINLTDLVRKTEHKLKKNKSPLQLVKQIYKKPHKLCLKCKRKYEYTNFSKHKCVDENFYQSKKKTCIQCGKRMMFFNLQDHIFEIHIIRSPQYQNICFYCEQCNQNIQLKDIKNHLKKHQSQRDLPFYEQMKDFRYNYFLKERQNIIDNYIIDGVKQDKGSLKSPSIDNNDISSQSTNNHIHFSFSDKLLKDQMIKSEQTTCCMASNSISPLPANTQHAGMNVSNQLESESLAKQQQHMINMNNLNSIKNIFVPNNNMLNPAYNASESNKPLTAQDIQTQLLINAASLQNKNNLQQIQFIQQLSNNPNLAKNPILYQNLLNSLNSNYLNANNPTNYQATTTAPQVLSNQPQSLNLEQILNLQSMMNNPLINAIGGIQNNNSAATATTTTSTSSSNNAAEKVDNPTQVTESNNNLVLDARNPAMVANNPSANKLTGQPNSSLLIFAGQPNNPQQFMDSYAYYFQNLKHMEQEKQYLQSRLNQIESQKLYQCMYMNQLKPTPTLGSNPINLINPLVQNQLNNFISQYQIQNPRINI